MLFSFPSLSPGTSSYTHTSTTQPQHNHAKSPSVTMSSYHPNSLCVDIVGIIASDCGHCCDDHPFCGEVVALDNVVHFWCEMIHVAGGTDGGLGREEPALVVYWVTDGIGTCCIGFLPWHMNHQAAHHDDVLGQISATFSGTHLNYAVHEKWHRNMGFCHEAIISPLSGDAPVVQMAGGGVAALGEGGQTGVDVAGLPDGVNVAESMNKFCLGGSLPRRLKSSYFCHRRPMAESPHLRDGILFEVTVVGDTNSGVSCDAIWRRVMAKKKECETAVLAVLDTNNSGLLVCHRKA
jgi:hypothetical protein